VPVVLRDDLRQKPLLSHWALKLRGVGKSYRSRFKAKFQILGRRRLLRNWLKGGTGRGGGKKDVRAGSLGANRSVLFLQCTNAGLYPPILNAATLFADRGWQVTILSSPSADTVALAVEEYSGVTHLTTRLRPRNAVRPVEYLNYILTAIRCARRLRPTLIYASDPIGALPALAASKASGAQIIYHEHDSPRQLRPWLARIRLMTVRSARLIVFPNESRSVLAREELGFLADRLHIVWNLPRLAELPTLTSKAETPLIIYYHGSIAPERLPEAVVEAVHRFHGLVQLRFAGYEVPSAHGYIERLLALGRRSDGDPLVQYLGQLPLRKDLLTEAAQAHIGLAFVPGNSADVNLRHMTGASNKAFDYMAAGLALLVSDLSDWREIFVAHGCGRACDPADPGSLTAALKWFLHNAAERRAMAERNRAKIERDWNYETGFAKVLGEVDNW
jgi:glycosyltransferase involved in cell wall biosynthesis